MSHQDLYKLELSLRAAVIRHSADEMLSDVDFTDPDSAPQMLARLYGCYSILSHAYDLMERSSENWKGVAQDHMRNLERVIEQQEAE